MFKFKSDAEKLMGFLWSKEAKELLVEITTKALIPKLFDNTINKVNKIK